MCVLTKLTFECDLIDCPESHEKIVCLLDYQGLMTAIKDCADNAEKIKLIICLCLHHR